MRPSEELYQSLEAAYQYFNKVLFNDKLPDVIFTVQRQKGVMGFFAPERWSEKGGRRCHEIAINPSYIAQSRLIEIMQTLVHEMVHCWQYSFGQPSRGHYHNKEWAYKMIEIGLMPSSTGEPGGSITGQFMSDYILENKPFHGACVSLLGDQGFEIKWADRKAFPRLFEPNIVSLPEAEKVEESDDFNPIDSSMYFANSDSTRLDSQLVSPWLENPTEDFFIDNTVPRKTRIRYMCPKCETKVYGKASLNIRCEDCDQKFIQSEL